MNIHTITLLSLCISLPILMHSMNDPEKNEQLRHAVRQGILWRVEEALYKWADVNHTDQKNRSPLYIAVEYNDTTKIIELLLDNGADINSWDEDGRTPLEMAIWRRNKKMVKFLLDRGADVNHKDESGYTPLQFAIAVGNSALIQLLLEYGADKNIRDKNGNTALDIAIARNQEEIVQLLNQAPSSERVSARALIKRIKLGESTLEEVKNSVSKELYTVVIELILSDLTYKL